MPLWFDAWQYISTLRTASQLRHSFRPDHIWVLMTVTYSWKAHRTVSSLDNCYIPTLLNQVLHMQWYMISTSSMNIPPNYEKLVSMFYVIYGGWKSSDLFPVRRSQGDSGILWGRLGPWQTVKKSYKWQCFDVCPKIDKLALKAANVCSVKLKRVWVHVVGGMYQRWFTTKIWVLIDHLRKRNTKPPYICSWGTVAVTFTNNLSTKKFAPLISPTGMQSWICCGISLLKGECGWLERNLSKQSFQRFKISYRDFLNTNDRWFLHITIMIMYLVQWYNEYHSCKNSARRVRREDQYISRWISVQLNW